MSASIYWRPAAQKGKAIRTSTPSKFSELVPAGDYDASHLGYLQGLAAMGLEGAQQLIDAIEQHEVVTLDVSW